MAALPYMQLYVADYLADTAHLNAAQNGAYLLLIFNYWQRGKPLNNSNERLANVARMSNEEWTEAKPILSEFFEIDGDEWKHARIERDLLAVNSKSGKASEAGKASAASRASKRLTNAEQTLNHKDVDTDVDTDTYKEKTLNTKSPVVDLFVGVSAQVVSDFKATRNKLKAPITKTAIAGIQREADKAGISLESALTHCIERNWRGFKAEWLDRPTSTIISWQDKKQAADDATNKAMRDFANAGRVERLVVGEVV